jgi:hypothetical protein
MSQRDPGVKTGNRERELSEFVTLFILRIVATIIATATKVIPHKK